MVNATLRPLYLQERDSYPLYRRLGGLQGRSGRVRKISPPQFIFFGIFFYSVLHPYFFPGFDCPAFCLLLVLFSYNAQKNHFYSIVLSLYFNCTFFFGLFFLAFCPYCTTHNTNIPNPSEIRTRNLSKRAATDPCHRTLGHWDRLFDPPTVQPVASRCTDWAVQLA